jgi:lambda repressor-like predicted transcriptional regulator
MTQNSYAYLKRWRYERSHGLLRTTDPGRVTEHIDQLRGAGWSVRSIAEAAGVCPTAVSRLLLRKQTCVTRKVAEKLLAVDPGAILARDNRAGFVLKAGAVRRIQALLAIGHRHEDITAAMRDADRAIRTTSQLVMHQRGVWVAASTRDAVCAAYERLSMHPGPSAKTVRLAAKSGYAPPLAWDDESIDNPEATPVATEDSRELDEVLVLRIMAGSWTVPAHAQCPERDEAIRRLAGQLTDGEIAARIGMSKDAVCHTRLRKDIPAFQPSGRRSA